MLEQVTLPRALALACAATVFVACRVADYDPTGKRCDGAHACPDGFECLVGTCVKPCTRPAPVCTGAGCALTVAGSGGPGFKDGAPTDALFRAPTHLIALPSGELIVSDSGNNALRSIPLDGGAVTTLVGGGECDYANLDTLCQPRGLARGSDGALYVVSSGTNIVHRVANGQIQRFAGDGTANGLNRPLSLAAAADRIIVADAQNCQLRFFELDGGPASAPLGGCGDLVDGRTLEIILAVAVSPDAQTVYFMDIFPSLYSAPLTNGVPSGPAHRLTSGDIGFTDGPLDSASFAHPTALAADATGVFVADEHNNRLRYAKLGGDVSTVAGDGNEGVSDGPVPAYVSEPGGIATLNGAVFFSAPLDHRIRRVQNGVIDTVAGGAAAPLADGCADAVRLAAPTGLDVDPSTGVVLFTDALHHAVRAMAPDGAVVTVTGGTPGSRDDDFAHAQLNFPGGLRLRADGGVVIADTGNGTLRQLDTTARTVTTLAGVPHAANFRSATCVTRLSNPPSTAVLCNPQGLVVAPTGELYFGDAADDGTGVVGRLSADGQKVDEVLRVPLTPRGLAWTPQGTLAVTDASSAEVREYDVQGNQVSVLASATACSDTPQPAGNGCDPADVAYSGDTLLVLYRFNAALRAFPPSGAPVTWLGTPNEQGLADGTQGSLMDRPLGLAVAKDGTVFIADSRNNRLRQLTR